MLGLTGAQGGRRDLDLTGDLVGMEGRGSTASTEVCSKQVGALSPCGAGTGTIASMMGLLFVVHCYQLEEGSEDVGFEKHVGFILHQMTIMKSQDLRKMWNWRKKYKRITEK